MRSEGSVGRTRRPFPIGRRGRVLLGLFLLVLVSWNALGLSLTELWPSAGGVSILRLFLDGALHPALDYQAANVPEGTPALLIQVLEAIWRTLLFAAAGIGLALVMGLVLGLLGSSRLWSKGAVQGVLFGIVRTTIVLMRSVHELLWAVLFLAALGLHSLGAVVAIAIPYAGTLAKVFSELLDECAPEPADSLRAIGASRLRAFLVGTLPTALRDMSAYAFYRFECALRSSAVLGFFGYPTLGFYLRQSADNLHYREVWTYLYALIALVLLLELWSSELRKRMGQR